MFVNGRGWINREGGGRGVEKYSPAFFLAVIPETAEQNSWRLERI